MYKYGYMKKKTETTEKKKYDIVPVTIKGEQYYTWPQAQEINDCDRDELRRRMKKMDIKPFAIEPYYLFVKVKDVYKLKEGETKANAMEKLVNKLSAEKLDKLASLIDENNPELKQLFEMLEGETGEPTPVKTKKK